MNIDYRASSFCSGADCVEVRVFPTGYAHVRASKHPERTPLVFTPDEWAAFVEGVKNGEFDPPGAT